MSEEKKKEKDIITIIENYYKSMTKEKREEHIKEILKLDEEGKLKPYSDY